MKLSNLLLVAAALASCSTPQQPEWQNPVLEIAGGKVQGVELDSTNVLVYRGIPYAAPPVENLRWKRPQPVPTWDTIMIADHFGNAAMQRAHNPNDGRYGTEFFAEDAPFSEDCLYLNVWTPKDAAGDTTKKLPVAMWVHGGGYSGGWGFEPEMDGQAWAERGVILVTINYRLGVMGFMNHPELSAENADSISGNYGFYDQAYALQWVHDNIAQFGGNPDDITILGQSAGATSIKTLCVSPLTKNLVKKSIIQSAGGMRPGEIAYNQRELDAQGKRVMDEAGLTSLEKMRAASWEELEKIIASQRGPGHQPFSMGVHVDGVGLVEMFEDGAKNGTIADVPYLVGQMENDIHDVDTFSDFVQIREPLSTQPVYKYYFKRALPSDGRPSIEGAFHSGELWYEFHTLGRSWRPFTAADYELSDRMVNYWTNFAKYGNPNGNEANGEWKVSTVADPYVQVLDIK